jgi:hypothetical protein
VNARVNRLAHLPGVCLMDWGTGTLLGLGNDYDHPAGHRALRDGVGHLLCIGGSAADRVAWICGSSGSLELKHGL